MEQNGHFMYSIQDERHLLAASVRLVGVLGTSYLFPGLSEARTMNFHRLNLKLFVPQLIARNVRKY